MKYLLIILILSSCSHVVMERKTVNGKPIEKWHKSSVTKNDTITHRVQLTRLTWK